MRCYKKKNTNEGNTTDIKGCLRRKVEMTFELKLDDSRFGFNLRINVFL